MYCNIVKVLFFQFLSIVDPEWMTLHVVGFTLKAIDLSAS
jgi:hypothetical protein